ncbi:hypothetical protein CAL7716_050910 [Calothrix sp. PCC 7716]|nr:hypothetical protein CAL7716_050910 [Calothrix sp. PCC 7716]
MRYTLKSRFQGTIAGALLGLELAKDSKLELIRQAYIEITFSCKSLIAQGKFDSNSFCAINQADTPLNQQLNQQVLLNTLFSALPVILFFHEDLSKLRYNLLEVSRVHSHNLIVRDSVLAIGYTIAQSLNEKLSQSSIFSEIIRFIGETPTNTPQQLVTVNSLLKQQVSLEQAFTELHKVNTLSNVVAIAFYTFFKSLEDFCLSVSLNLNGKILSFNNHDYYLSSVMTGALSGAYNSALGIPISWQIKNLRHLSAKTGVPEFLQMLKLVDELLAIWSGVCEFDNQNAKKSKEKDLCNYLPLLEQSSHLSVYAAPRIIRLR